MCCQIHQRSSQWISCKAKDPRTCYTYRTADQFAGPLSHGPDNLIGSDACCVGTITAHFRPSHTVTVHLEPQKELVQHIRVGSCVDKGLSQRKLDPKKLHPANS